MLLHFPRSIVSAAEKLYDNARGIASVAAHARGQCDHRPLAARPSAVGRAPHGQYACAPRPVGTRDAVGFGCLSEHAGQVSVQPNSMDAEG